VAPEGITKDGFERHWGVNYMGPFLFTHDLLPLLIKGSSPQFRSRIVNVSSTGHRLFPIHLEDPNNEQNRPYDPMSAYATSKLANVLHANYLDKMLSPKGVRAVSLHPGTVMETQLLRNVQATPSQAEETIPALTDGETGEYKSAEQGAATIVFAAIAECLEDKGGLYLENCTVGKEAPQDLGPLDGGYSKEAFDEAAAEKLWKLTCQQLNLQDGI
jgi:NAD(P)-dependent dehydrogenase (short-subunit alcohol dehydrogenase family)